MRLSAFGSRLAVGVAPSSGLVSSACRAVGARRSAWRDTTCADGRTASRTASLGGDRVGPKPRSRHTHRPAHTDRAPVPPTARDARRSARTRRQRPLHLGRGDAVSPPPTARTRACTPPAPSSPCRQVRDDGGDGRLGRRARLAAGDRLRGPVMCAIFTCLSSGWRHIYSGQPVKMCATPLRPRERDGCQLHERAGRAGARHGALQLRRRDREP